ncbi:2-desacetyl-2-hydroxyethyl bacteriochlorophyllide A dehydrogenase [Anoxybacillus tepidamans]|uniref:2-desacetyl-2-hydroxyethyl bacteriochlorophyllide A dehydrogenase n=1 Tax=Anoxybacteroides tepidamans TaxID=265948 RepID=A0A7W8MW93_9BACL|nr:2-desacetyl-2-hydroxyethyl bacteriochlorophyllide A dehydrogenase [Anoxybacillus tepidamans]
MKQVKAFGPGDLRVVEVEPPVLGEGEVLVDVHACGICGSDKWFWYVDSPNDYVAGHEVAGEVVDVGPGVKNLKVGDRVSVNNVKGCGQCSACQEGQFVRCSGSVTHMGFGFSEKVAVPECNCLKLEPEISYVAGSLIFDNWGTPYSAIKRTSMKKGHIVVVTGCGPIGLAAVALAKLRGAQVIAVDPIKERLEAANRLGAQLTVSPGADAFEKINTFTNDQGVDIVLECSGKPASYELALSVLKVAGTLVSIGEGAKFNFNSSDIIHKHLTIIGSLYSTMKDGAEIQELMVKGEIDPLAFVTHTFRLEEIPSSFEKVISCSDGLLKAVVVR